ncbi:MAG: hypothetical protein HC944_03065 [Nanoarchaeota archaeon]|nr:hypothetical protein [Nanoarchaeota archaeon]
MSLEDQAKQILNNFDGIPSDEFIKILTKIQPTLKSQITRDYLNGKIQGVLAMTDEAEKKKFCKTLKPYLDWYIQGNA